MKTVYGPVLIPTPSPDIEMAVDAPEMEEVAFTLITNKKYKDKGKVFFFFLVINLLHSALSQSMADYLQQVAYSFKGLRGQKPPS